MKTVNIQIADLPIIQRRLAEAQEELQRADEHARALSAEIERLRGENAIMLEHSAGYQQQLDAMRRRICQHWQAAKLSEGQAAHLLGVDRLEARRISIALGVRWTDDPEEA